MARNVRKYWIITDTHFNHQKIHDFCDRPVGFEETILKNMENCIGENDILIHLGDVAWKDDGYWHNRIMEIPCFRRWLVKGNHDRKTQSWYLNRGWDFVGKTLSLDIHNRRIIFPLVWMKTLLPSEPGWDMPDRAPVPEEPIE